LLNPKLILGYCYLVVGLVIADQYPHIGDTTLAIYTKLMFETLGPISSAYLSTCKNNGHFEIDSRDVLEGI